MEQVFSFVGFALPTICFIRLSFAALSSGSHQYGGYRQEYDRLCFMDYCDAFFSVLLVFIPIIGFLIHIFHHSFFSFSGYCYPLIIFPWFDWLWFRTRHWAKDEMQREASLLNMRAKFDYDGIRLFQFAAMCSICLFCCTLILLVILIILT